MMRVKKLIATVSCLFLFSCLFAQDNQLTDEEKKAGWKLLFNGENLDGWQAIGGQRLVNTWLIEDGALSLRPNRPKQMDLISAEQYDDFDLMADFKLTEGANAGIKYFFINYPNGTWLGPEYQIIDNDRHPDAKDEDRRLGALYDIFPAQKPVDVAVGAWNRLRIYAKGKEVIHYLNGQEILRYDRSSEAFLKGVASSKFKDVKPVFGTLDKGHIMIQDHDDIVYFKNIKIKAL